MTTILIILHVVLAASLIAIVLVQRGQGATMGAAFGAGASGTVFGARGAGNFLTRTTGWLAIGFFGISLTLAVLAARNSVDPDDQLGVAGSLAEQQQAAQMQAESESGDDSATVTPDIPTEGGSASDAPVEASPATGDDASGGELPAMPAEETTGEETSGDDGNGAGN